ncbi:MAG: cob(I)yrinic acid a,c-diamide adenosyltransferase [Syntrophorhabdaceae bacterium]|nr:cob(I)yrinic acid a,c-diamide adenosyltransferase [Syntrophorhabdaceae bacterium]
MKTKGKNRVIIFTGDGKGKTTAALGLALRALGHNKKVVILQFIKADKHSGELSAISSMKGIDIIQVGLGFVPKKGSPEFDAHKKAAEHGLLNVKRLFHEGRYNVYILDEICNAIVYGLIKEEDVINVIKEAPDGSVLVLTGRGATKGLVDLADTVTEMVSIKHGYQTGIKAQEGVEW